MKNQSLADDFTISGAARCGQEERHPTVAPNRCPEPVDDRISAGWKDLLRRNLESALASEQARSAIPEQEQLWEKPWAALPRAYAGRWSWRFPG